MHQIGEVARKIPVLFPVHPRTRRMLEDIDVRPGIQVVDPVGYLDFLALEADAAAVLTDSGGAQEETTHLGVPRFRLRDDTKRPVTARAGTNTLLGLSPKRIADILPGFRENGRVPLSPPPGWDGRAAERVADVIERLTELPADSSAAVTP
jgi:UDP-N-acetylglucosamine 2-epimerase (non-hydrolysing)